MSEIAQTVADLAASTRAALALAETDTSNPGLVARIGLRDTLRSLEQLQRSIAYEQGITDGSLRQVWPQVR